MLDQSICKSIRVIFALTAALFISCKSGGGNKEIPLQDGKLLISTSPEGVLEGIGKFYDNKGLLKGTYNYKNGKRAGVGVIWYPNGVAKDSVQYSNDILDGLAIHYDSTGKIKRLNYYYYGLEFGPELIFENGKASEFNFRNLNKKVIVSSHFGQNEIVDSISEFKMDFRVISKLIDTVKMNEIFAYLPEMASVSSSYSIGITDKNHHDSSIFSVTGKRFMLDTVLPKPPAGSHYFISCHLQSIASKFNHVYVEDFIDTLNRVGKP